MGNSAFVWLNWGGKHKDKILERSSFFSMDICTSLLRFVLFLPFSDITLPLSGGKGLIKNSLKSRLARSSKLALSSVTQAWLLPVFRQLWSSLEKSASTSFLYSSSAYHVWLCLKKGEEGVGTERMVGITGKWSYLLAVFLWLSPWWQFVMAKNVRTGSLMPDWDALYLAKWLLIGLRKPPN